MTHYNTAQANDDVTSAVCTCSVEAKCGSNPPPHALCCCLDYCTCQSSKSRSHRYNTHSNNPSQRYSTRRHSSRDKRSHSRRCLYCIPEQILICEDEIAKRQQSCRATRGALLKKRRELKNILLLGPCINSYRRNTAELLRISSKKFYQYELDREYESRVRQLREELRTREKEWARRKELYDSQEVRDRNGQNDQRSLDTFKQFPPPCPRCDPKRHESKCLKQNLSRCRHKPLCHFPRPGPCAQSVNRKQEASPPAVQDTPDKDAKAPSPQKSNGDSSRCSPRFKSTNKFLEGHKKHASFFPRNGKTSFSSRQDGAPIEAFCSSNREESSCPFCGYPLTRASAAEVVSMLAKGKFNDFSHCSTCGFVVGKPSSGRSKPTDHSPTRSSSAQHARSALCACLRSPLYGRRVFITDDAYLESRSKLFSQLEKAGAIERIPETQRSSSTSLSECTPKWRTLPSRSIEVK